MPVKRKPGAIMLGETVYRVTITLEMPAETEMVAAEYGARLVNEMVADRGRPWIDGQCREVL